MLHYIVDASNGNRFVPLLPESFHTNSNVYTLLVGKNGTGKSRCLAAIASQQSRSDQFRKVLAISTSPFDRFPVGSRSRFQLPTDRYSYVGVRDGMMAMSSSVGLLASPVRGLLIRLAGSRSLPEMAAILRAIGFSSSVRLAYRLPMPIGAARSRNYAVPDGIRSRPSLMQLIDDIDINLDERRIERLISLSAREIRLVKSIVGGLRQEGKKASRTGFYDLNFEPSSESPPAERSREAEGLALALELGVIRIADLLLDKIGVGELSLKRASSGEQCLLVLLLGIASQLEDESLVLIDEPELSLHPKWQEEFMSMLIGAFSQFRGCQFVIATHSPQIVSRMLGKNCFISSLSSGEVHPASDYSKRSADYQLAELFGAPGLMNEYISRVAFGLIARMKASGNVGPEARRDYLHLISISSNVESGDPTHELISTVREAFKYYDNRD